MLNTGNYDSYSTAIKSIKQLLLMAEKNIIKQVKETYSTKEEAYSREKQIKRYKGGRAFRELLDRSNNNK